jgi:hypothetical protein
MGHEIFERFFFHGLPGPGDRKNKAPAAGRIGFVTGLDHGHVRLGTIGGIPAHNYQLGPTRGHKRPHHLAKQGIFTAVPIAARAATQPAPGWGLRAFGPWRWRGGV